MSERSNHEPEPNRPSAEDAARKEEAARQEEAARNQEQQEQQEQQARQVFEDFLVQREFGVEIPIAETKRRYPALAPSLARQEEALATLERTLARVRPRRRWRIVAAAALLLMSISLWFAWSSWPHSEDPIPVSPRRFDACIDVVQTVCAKGVDLSVWSAQDWNVIAYSVGLLRESTVKTRGGSLPPGQILAARRALRLFDDGLQDHPEARVAMSDAQQNPVGSLQGDLAFILVSARDPSAPAPTERSSLASLELSVFDCDDGGAPVSDFEVLVQPVDVREGILGEAWELEPLSGLDSYALESGEYRVTVIDPAQGRFSQQRLFVEPGLEFLRAIFFLREGDAVTESMAYFEAAEIEYGIDDGEERIDLHRPAVPVSVPALYFDPYEVTNEEYARFLADWRDHPEWAAGLGRSPVTPMLFTEGGGAPEEYAQHPVVGVPWEDARIFANWAGKRLATCQEWERVAKGAENRKYPWGEDFEGTEVDCSNAFRPGVDGDTFRTGGVRWGPVDDYPLGVAVSDDGVEIHRLSDNVSEWTADLLVEPDDSGSAYLFGNGGDVLLRVARGGSWLYCGRITCRTVIRHGFVPANGQETVGLRCARSVAPPIERP